MRLPNPNSPRSRCPLCYPHYFHPRPRCRLQGPRRPTTERSSGGGAGSVGRTPWAEPVEASGNFRAFVFVLWSHHRLLPSLGRAPCRKCRQKLVYKCCTLRAFTTRPRLEQSTQAYNTQPDTLARLLLPESCPSTAVPQGGWPIPVDDSLWAQTFSSRGRA